MFFFAPSDEDIRWVPSGAGGAKKFCQRVHALVHDCAEFVRATATDAPRSIPLITLRRFQLDRDIDILLRADG